MNQHEETWKTYVASWRAPSIESKRALLQRSLAVDCAYADPFEQTRGWEQLMTYMARFHRQSSGSYFVTLEFATHHGRSLAKWEMRDAQDNGIGDGIGYGEYDRDGKLVSISNFFQVPEHSP